MRKAKNSDQRERNRERDRERERETERGRDYMSLPTASRRFCRVLHVIRCLFDDVFD